MKAQTSLLVVGGADDLVSVKLMCLKILNAVEVFFAFFVCGSYYIISHVSFVVALFLLMASLS